jgi:EAL domain-containing protein (putative c-di-GMP-specific phosphodiesterase class I)
MRIGIAQSGADCREGRTLLAQADLALSLTYGADELTYQFFSPALADEARSRQALARDLERALERGELFLALQPKVRLDGDLGHPVSGAEVLLRWFHAARGPVSPAEFIPVAEATGLILPIGAFVLEAACGLARDWRARLGASPRLAVNLSAQQFAQPDLCAQAARAIARAGIPPDTIEFEITETAAMKDVERTAATLAAMRELGVRVAIDDFGTGYSSLNYLRRFAVDAIKIDKSFVDEIGSDRNAEAICDAILRLGQSLGTRVVAEGVETEAQATFLRRRRCDEAQGYLYGRPVPSDEFERLYLGERVAATSAA